ncbi:hypothetical protein SUGI_0715160 [Cryptomeria japonica]|nr:hypothetical protein SUGI_0715160 [Cryptomeria japonica]
MKELKVLIINNYSARRATLRGLNGFEKLSQLKTLQLERLLVPPLYEHFNFLKSLEKLSLSLCEGLGNMSRLDESKFFNFPGLSEFNVDHCSDLEELPRGIFSSNSLKLLLVRNCHQLLKLPDELGKLERLEVLSLCACARLEVLPYSIQSLQQLEILDISQCGNLKVFPDKFHELSRLKKVDMRECSKLPEFCRMLGKLGSLNHVICSEKNEKQLKPLSNGNVNVEVVEEQFGLDWLYSWPEIPETHDKDLVKQVQVECKGLPEALRVIGRSMRRQEDPMFWKRAINKLSGGETISSYHNGLYERLKTSIDVLDHNAKCFLDLAAFPEGRTISANALLDIWVYVHGMEPDDTFVLFVDFAITPKARTVG